MTLVRTVLGEQLRRRRQDQRRTLRDVSGRARVSLGYLSEVERGQKEPSSELLASICEALGVRVSAVLRDASEDLFVAEVGGMRARELSGERLTVLPEISRAATPAHDDADGATRSADVSVLAVGVPVDRAA